MSGFSDLVKLDIQSQVGLNNKYILVKELGKGQFGKVFKGFCSQGAYLNQEVAIKVSAKQMKQLCQKGFELFMSEVNILKQINNPNVVKFYDYFEDNKHCFLVEELCTKGELENYILSKPRKRLDEAQAVIFYKQILNGFKGLHQQNVIHRDIKLANILMDHDENLKIADLGFAKQLMSEFTGTILGTPLTMAPELLEGKQYGLSADIFSVGVIFYQMVFGDFPFKANTEMQLINNIKNQKYTFNVPGVNTSQNLQDLLSKMLKYKCEERITWANVYLHPLFKEEDNPMKNNINLGALSASKIKMNDNLLFYQNNQNPNQQQQQQQQQQQNQQQQQQEQKVNNQLPQIQEQPAEYQQNQESNLKMQQQQAEQQKIKEQMEEYLKQNQAQEEARHKFQLYINEVNIYKQIAKTIFSAHQLPQTQINTFYPCFFMLKKLKIFYQKFISQLEKKENIFDCKNPQILFNLDLYAALIQDSKNTLQLVQDYYMIRKMDIQEIFANHKKDKKLEDQFNNDDILDANFEQFYTQILIDYYHSLKKEYQTKNSNIFLKHAQEVVLMIDLQKIYRQQPIFDFEKFQVELDQASVNDQSLMNYCEQTLNKVKH